MVKFSSTPTLIHLYGIDRLTKFIGGVSLSLWRRRSVAAVQDAVVAVAGINDNDQHDRGTEQTVENRRRRPEIRAQVGA